MINKKILLISTYPIANPQHGGQKRVDALVREYKKLFSQVKFCAIFNKPFYNNYSNNDIALSDESSRKVLESPFTGDIVSGLAIELDKTVKNKLTKLITTFKPDIIEVEQVFPYIGLKALLDEIGIKPIIVSSTHNIEYKMKEEMLLSLGWSKSEVDKQIQIIREAEEEITKEAALVSAVSEKDIYELKRMGARKIVLAPNGIYKTKATEESLRYWTKKFKSMNVNKIFLFVGSAHPPNWIGFNEIIGRSLGFIPYNSRIVFAGSISEYVSNELSKYKFDIGSTTFAKRAFFAGRLSEDKLNGLLEIADTILLPITEGGGSNLKTAEAIVSGKKVVATSYAFRGYEDLKNLKNIYISDKPEDYRKLMIKSIDTELETRTDEENKLAESVLWPNCLKNLIKEMAQI